MGILCPVILPATCVVTPRNTKFARRRTVGSELVGDDGGWSDALLLQKFAIPDESFACGIGLDGVDDALRELRHVVPRKGHRQGVSERFVLHAKALPGNPYDGHTLGPVIAAAMIFTHPKPRFIAVRRVSGCSRHRDVRVRGRRRALSSYSRFAERPRRGHGTWLRVSTYRSLAITPPSLQLVGTGDPPAR